MTCRVIWRLALPAVLVLAAGCGGDSGGDPDDDPGTLAVQVSGLPPGINGSVSVTGPGGYSHTVTSTETLANLEAGVYTLTPGAVTDAGFSYVAGDVATRTVTAGGNATATFAYAIKVLARSPTNRDDGGVINKFHVMYVLPSDATDRNLDTDGTITRTVSSWQRWFVAQTGGRHLQLDMSDGGLDITFARIDRSDAVMTSYGTFVRDTLEKLLVDGGYSSPNTLLLVYYDGGNSTACGSAALPPALPGVLGAIFLKGLATSSFPCANNPFATTPWAAPTYIEFTAAHEALHILGIVSAGAPDFNNYHVDTDPTDLMYAGPQAWRPATLDVSKTNYYNATTSLGAGVVNLANLPYLVP